MADQTPAVSPEEVTGFDPFSKLLGIEVVRVAEGQATVQMRLREDMANVHGTPHGGAVFTLADTALAIASNSHGVAAVALDVTITFCRPAPIGSLLTATAVEDNLTRSTGLYTINITSDTGKLIATARGTVFRTGKSTAAPAP
ncbi:hydroxyphenylacetyl-CoA thioesterase PaaI [Alicyclobacillus cycloheptanicus]|uniref:Acyl-CoA thioesterase n=1 Tax=Alicyclobacillus cycloheptanicus TaxID=1457 RepID=A0ABT9XKL0_9BACL|nr:hydroxyphenylacetyl-CoA thioesterase PaaI [Alicyclobacillus cycloheptanicus]MDQ0190323.1 acyl-CoA thioesterase [Alicyclobacillus cycloheptanicus]WDM00032.1 hydroxyphenylacetyl-CoA thioesterase PaaI [Alicyclobacillus cycloheptanicus]